MRWTRKDIEAGRAAKSPTPRKKEASAVAAAFSESGKPCSKEISEERCFVRGFVTHNTAGHNAEKETQASKAG